MNISLTVPEFVVAVESAKMRLVSSAAQSLNHATTMNRGMVARLSDEVCGACGELALAKAAGQWFIPSVNTFHRVPDCLGDVEVRSTLLSEGSLIVRDNDSGDRRYVLATVSAPNVRLVGWLYGHECMKPEFLRNPDGHRESWFIPQSLLRPIEELLSEGTPRDIVRAEQPSA